VDNLAIFLALACFVISAVIKRIAKTGGPAVNKAVATQGREIKDERVFLFAAGLFFCAGARPWLLLNSQPITGEFSAPGAWDEQGACFKYYGYGSKHISLRPGALQRTGSGQVK